MTKPAQRFPARNAEILRRVKDGASYAEAGAAMGLTANVVAGVCGRVGLKLGGMREHQRQRSSEIASARMKARAINEPEQFRNFREKGHEALRRKWREPKFRERMTKMKRERMRDPEHRAKMVSGLMLWAKQAKGATP